MDRSVFDAEFDIDQGLVQRRVFADPSIHRAELHTIFGRSWLFVAPAAWLARSGDFVTSRMGREPVIAWRDDGDVVRVFANRCVRSEEAVTQAPRGRAELLRCPCHGWAYVAGGADAPRMEPVARVAVWRGLVFANLDADALALEDAIGDLAWYLDLFLPVADPAEVYGDDAMRWIVEANWKLPVLAGCGDVFANPATHDDMVPHDGVQVSLGGGAITLRSRPTRANDDPRDGLAPLVAALFPNLWFDRDTHSLNVVHPIGPTRSEIHSYCLVVASATLAEREAARRLFQFGCGPAGIKSNHQARSWQAVTAGARSARHRDQLLSLRLGLGRWIPSNLPGHVAALVSEANQRSFFCWWQHALGRPVEVAPSVMRL